MTYTHNFGVFFLFFISLLFFSFFIQFILLHSSVKLVLCQPLFFCILPTSKKSNQPKFSVLSYHPNWELSQACLQFLSITISIVQSFVSQAVIGWEEVLREVYIASHYVRNTAEDCCPLRGTLSLAEVSGLLGCGQQTTVCHSPQLMSTGHMVPFLQETVPYVSCFTDMLWEVLKEFPDKSKGETSNSQIVKVKPLLDYENKFIQQLVVFDNDVKMFVLLYYFYICLFFKMTTHKKHSRQSELPLGKRKCRSPVIQPNTKGGG